MSFDSAPHPYRVFHASIGMLVLTLSGCYSAMPTPTPHDVAPSTIPAPDRRYTGTVADWPLFFKHHQFAVACFDTQTCKVEYGDFEFGSDQPTPSAASLSPERYDAAMTGHFGPVPRQAPPARVVWRCRNGSQLQAYVDIDDIFRDGLIRHNVRREEIPEQISLGNTHVILEVDDRTINVYTRTMIPLKEPRNPANPHSDFRDDLIKVFSRTY